MKLDKNKEYQIRKEYVMQWLVLIVLIWAAFQAPVPINIIAIVVLLFRLIIALDKVINQK